MEGLHTLGGMMQPDDWGVAVDITQAYTHVPLHPDARKYFRFQWRGQILFGRCS